MTAGEELPLVVLDDEDGLLVTDVNGLARMLQAAHYSGVCNPVAVYARFPDTPDELTAVTWVTLPEDRPVLDRYMPVQVMIKTDRQSTTILAAAQYHIDGYA